MSGWKKRHRLSRGLPDTDGATRRLGCAKSAVKSARARLHLASPPGLPHAHYKNILKLMTHGDRRRTWPAYSADAEYNPYRLPPSRSNATAPTEFSNAYHPLSHFHGFTDPTALYHHVPHYPEHRIPESEWLAGSSEPWDAAPPAPHQPVHLDVEQLYPFNTELFNYCDINSGSPDASSPSPTSPTVSSNGGTRQWAAGAEEDWRS